MMHLLEIAKLKESSHFIKIHMFKINMDNDREIGRDKSYLIVSCSSVGGSLIPGFSELVSRVFRSSRTSHRPVLEEATIYGIDSLLEPTALLSEHLREWNTKLNLVDHSSVNIMRHSHYCAIKCSPSCPAKIWNKHGNSSRSSVLRAYPSRLASQSTIKPVLLIVPHDWIPQWTDETELMSPLFKVQTYYYDLHMNTPKLTK
jgi:hypothetical protein